MAENVKKDENSYRSILKGTSAFGGVQIFQVLINALRGKLVAYFLGPEGMGISALFTTASSSIQQFASLGLNLAIVKEIAHTRNDASSLSQTLKVGRRLIYGTALLGLLACILFASPLSRLTFGSGNFTNWFLLLSLAVFLSIAAAGEMSLLQGMHAVKRLSLSSLIGASAGLLFGVPLYWLFGTNGIVPAMILLALTSWLFYFISVRRTIKSPHAPNMNWSEQWPLIRKLLGLGIVMMGAALIGTLTNYLIATYLRATASVDTVGFYQAANSLTNQYVGMVIAAMGIDYFPRLTAVADNNKAVHQIVNRQTIIISLLVTPIIVLVILSAPLIIRLLLTEEFETIVPVMRWMGFGVFFRVLVFPLGYIFYAKNNKRLYFLMEGLMGNAITLTLSILFFHYFGLVGLGMAVGVDCSLAVAIYLIVCHRLYKIGYSLKTWLKVSYAIIGAGAAFACSFIPILWLSYTLMGCIFFITALSAFFGLRSIIRKEKANNLPDSEKENQSSEE